MLAVGFVAVGALVAGCNPDQAGSAALIGDSRITEDALAKEAVALTDALQIPQTNKVNVFLLDRDLKKELVSRLAANKGVAVTPAQVAAFLDDQYTKGGGKEAVLAQLLQRGITADAIESVAVTQLQVEAVGKALLPNGTAEQQSQAVFIAAIELSDQLGIEVSPRFGQWDAKSLAVNPPADDLSSPAPVPAPTGLSEIPVQ
ncbi:MAG: hypothetical protein WCI74_14435 [Actinomycetes bacterium]